MSEEFDPVGATATHMSTIRALESARVVSQGEADKLYSDPLAELLTGPRVMKKYRELKAAGRNIGKFTKIIHVRTRFFDDTIVGNLAACSQVVLLGAGMDTRAYRLEVPKKDVTYYEVDKAEINAYKNKILGSRSPKCVRVSVDADLCTMSWVEKLTKAGFNKEVPTIWILEGLIYYLSENEAELLMKSIAEISATGSVFASDLANSALKADPLWKSRVQHPLDFLRKYEWSGCTAILPGEYARARAYSGYEKVDENWETDDKMGYWFASGKKE